jgi:hypothetical protein
MSRLVDLYPRAWRARYGGELLALLEERPPTLADRLDVVRGAFDARLHPQLPGGDVAPVDERSNVGRRAGWATLAGALVWLLSLVVAINGPLVRDGSDVYRDGMVAMPIFVLAMILLVVGLAATALRLPEPARVGRGAAWVAGVGLILWAMAPWVLLTGLAGVIGLAVLGLAAVRAGTWPALSLVVVVAVPAFVVAVAMGLVGGVDDGPDTWAIVFATLASIWLAVAWPLVAGRSARVPAAT